MPKRVKVREAEWNLRLSRGVAIIMADPSRFTFKQKLGTEPAKPFFVAHLDPSFRGNRKHLENVLNQNHVDGVSVRVSKHGNVIFLTKRIVATEADALRLIDHVFANCNAKQDRLRQLARERNKANDTRNRRAARALKHTHRKSVFVG